MTWKEFAEKHSRVADGVGLKAAPSVREYRKKYPRGWIMESWAVREDLVESLGACYDALVAVLSDPAMSQETLDQVSDAIRTVKGEPR